MHFIRHGQSVFNVAFNETGRDPGVRDAPLTPRGHEQAEAAAHHFAGKGFTKIICSPYSRALQTAKAISDLLQLPMIAQPLVGERRLYSCDIGTPRSDLAPLWPQVDFTAVTKNEWWPAKNESDDDINQRVKAFASMMSEPAAAQTIIVSHWYFIFTLTGCDCENTSIVKRDEQGVFHKMS